MQVIKLLQSLLLNLIQTQMSNTESLCTIQDVRKMLITALKESNESSELQVSVDIGLLFCLYLFCK